MGTFTHELIIAAAAFPLPRVMPPSFGETTPLGARNVACACGSGQRLKHCCGCLVVDAVPAADEAELQIALVCRANEFLLHGEADKAAALLQRLQPKRIGNALLAREAGEMYLDMHRLQRAAAFLQRALLLSDADAHAREAWQECCHLLRRSARWSEAARTLRATLQRLQRHERRPRAIAHAHVVCKLDTLGGTERRALNLYRQLSRHVPTTLWSTQAPLASHAAEAPIRTIGPDGVPSGGVLALVGTYFPCGEWLATQPFERVVVCHNVTEQHTTLAQRLAAIETNPARPQARLTFPSHLFRAATHLPGLVEYSETDLQHFRRERRLRADGKLVIGRHGRAYPLKFHPNDAAFFRELIARGHTVRVLGGSAVSALFSADTGARPELLEVGAQDAKLFLDTLDVFVYRKHPRFFETCGSVILEAMAMELPVVVFSGDCGATELIRHGENGFLIDSEGAAFDIIARLAADADLRARIGAAARASIADTLTRQAQSVRDFYLAAPDN